jgi:nitroimidazol reductase NimA-like FMN-containing flavoprotein (pyridoxamine 5'-phosphate oxidase superfamily)
VTGSRVWARPRPTVVRWDEHGLGVLSETACRSLLATNDFGRLGMSYRSLPVVFPVNYVLEGDTIRFRSEAGAKVDMAGQGVVACLEIDGFERFEHSGWSVMATGRLREADPVAAQRVRTRLRAWALPEADVVIEMPIQLLTGRVVGTVAASAVVEDDQVPAGG